MIQFIASHALLFASGWILCGIIAAGFWFPNIMKSGGTHRGNLLFSLVVGILLGPIALLLCLFIEKVGENGWRLW